MRRFVGRSATAKHDPLADAPIMHRHIPLEGGQTRLIGGFFVDIRGTLFTGGFSKFHQPNPRQVAKLDERPA